ncbi:MAG: hypothetical protein RLZZ517_347 [Candidatus Parcubacteria bacterium]
MEKASVLFKNSKEFMEGKKKNLLLVMFVPVAAGLISTLVGELFGISMKVNVILGAIVFIILAVVTLGRFLIDFITPFAFVNFIHSSHKGKILSPINSYKFGWRMTGSILLIQIARALIMFVGLAALIVPGIYLGFMLMLTEYSYITQKRGGKNSLVYSFHIMQGNIWNLIKKHLYAALEMCIPGLLALISLAILVTSSISSLKHLGFIPLAILGLAGFIYFGIKTIKVSLVLQDYMYAVFKEIEKTKGDISEKDLAKSAAQLKNWITKSVLIALVVIIVATSIYFSVLSK